MPANAAQDDIVSLVKLKIDEPVLARTNAAIRQLRADLDALGTAQARVAQSGNAGGQSTVTTINAQSNALKQATANAQQYAGALAQARANAGAFPQGTIGEGSGGGGFLDTLRSSRGTTNLGRIGSELRALPSVRIGGIGTDSIANVIRLGGVAEALGVTAGTAATALAVAVPLVVGFGLAIDALNKSIEAGRNSLKAALSAQDTYYDALKSKTTEQARDQVAELQRTQPILQQQIGETRSQLVGAFNQAVATFGDAGARALDAAGKLPTAQLREQLSKLEAEFNANTDAATRLTDGINGNVFAANDAVEAEKALQQSRIDSAGAARAAAEQQIGFATASADQLRKTRVDLANRIGLDALQINRLSEGGITSGAEWDRLQADIISASTALQQVSETFLPIAEHADQVTQSLKLQTSSARELNTLLDKTTEDYNHLSAVISGLQQTGAATPETLAALNDQLARDAALVQELTTNYIPLAQAREDEAEALKNVAKAAEQVAKYQKEAAQIAADAAAKIAGINADTADKEVGIKRDTQNRLSDLANRFGIDQRRAQEDLDREIRQLRERALLDETQAVGRRDAVARYQAKAQADLQEKQDRENAKVTADRRKEDYQTELKELAQAQEDKLNELHAAQQKEIAAVKAAADKETAAKKSALDEQLADLHVFATSATGAWNGVLNTMLNGVKFLKEQVSDQLSGASGGSRASGKSAAGVDVRTSSVPASGSAVDQAMAQYASAGTASSSTGGYRPNAATQAFLDSLKRVSGYALGGDFPANRPMIVGERGPELYWPTRGGHIIPASELRAMANQFTLMLNLEGLQEQAMQITSREQAHKVFDLVLRRMGV